MKVFQLIALAFLSVMSPALAATAEDYMDTHNPARIYDWGTVDLLRSIKLKRVKIDAHSHDEVIAELEKIAHGTQGAEKMRVTFPSKLWKDNVNAATGKIKMGVALDFSDRNEPNLNLLLVVRYVAELGQMTFSIKENEIVFRPMYG